MHTIVSRCPLYLDGGMEPDKAEDDMVGGFCLEDACGSVQLRSQFRCKSDLANNANQREA